MNKVLILGASGLVGKALIKELNLDYDVYGTYYSNNIELPSNKAFRFDMNDINNVKQILEEVEPHIIISCLRGDFNKQLKAHIEIARYLKNTNGKLYFCSTANVFDHDSTKPHYEDEEINAESDYGIFKAKCEKELEGILKKDLTILRLPMIFGKDSPRLNDLLDKLNKDNEIEVYANLYLTTNTDVILAKQIHYIIKTNLQGIFHLATNDVINYYDFISQLIKRLGYKDVKLKKISLPMEKYYLAVLSKRKEIINELRISNEDIINYLAN